MPHWLTILALAIAGWVAVSVVAGLLLARLLQLTSAGGHERGFEVVATRRPLGRPQRRQDAIKARRRIA